MRECVPSALRIVYSTRFVSSLFPLIVTVTSLHYPIVCIVVGQLKITSLIKIAPEIASEIFQNAERSHSTQTENNSHDLLRLVYLWNLFFNIVENVYCNSFSDSATLLRKLAKKLFLCVRKSEWSYFYFSVVWCVNKSSAVECSNKKKKNMLSAGLGYGTPGSGTTPPYSPPPRHSPLPSFGFTQEQVACVCEVRLQIKL